MGGCCGKRETLNSSSDPANLGGLTSNEVPRQIDYANKFIKDRKIEFN